MKIVNFTEFRQHASELINDVENGEIIQVLRHGKPVAKIIPCRSKSNSSPSWKRPALRLLIKGASLSKAIIDERKS